MEASSTTAYGTAGPWRLRPQTASKFSLHQCGNKLTVFPYFIPPD